ncbi:hypothetical protein HQ524_03455 [Candidatus Uhrbacteria bacterium]|nr:hypothetical protein [Candidatus Uhrbacteria bacterium]
MKPIGVPRESYETEAEFIAQALDLRPTDQLLQQLMFAMAGRVVPIPGKACLCGKPVVFTRFPDLGFECTRCGRKWKLILEIELTEDVSE